MIIKLKPSPCNLNLKAFWFGYLDLGLDRGVDVEKSSDCEDLSPLEPSNWPVVVAAAHDRGQGFNTGWMYCCWCAAVSFHYPITGLPGKLLHDTGTGHDRRVLMTLWMPPLFQSTIYFS